MSTKPILVGYDGSPSARTALAWAIDEATRTGRPLLLAYAFEWYGVTAPVNPGVSSWSDTVARQDATTMIQRATDEAAAAHPELAFDWTLLDGPSTVTLTEKSLAASLVVLGNRGHGGFTDLLVGSTSVTVSAHAHCPVVVVRGVQPAPDDPAPIIVGVDDSPGSLLALGYAFDQAAARDVRLHVLRAWTPPPPEWNAFAYNPETIVTTELAALEHMLLDWREKYPQVSVTTEVVLGSPGRVLAGASRDARLMVIGSRGRGGFQGLLLGSVSQQLLHHSHCPVAVIREMR
jgi:nucleotide-binding universal stress UspA family protein